MALLTIGMGLTSCDEQLDNAVVPGVTPEVDEKGEVTSITVDLSKIDEKYLDTEKTKLQLTVGDEVTLSFTILPEEMADTKVELTADDATILSIDGLKVKALKVGETKVTAKAGDKTAECTVTVTLAYPIALSAVTSEYVGSVVCSDGNVYPAKTAAPSGKTAVGILGKVTETGHGLILALQNATSQNWNTINGWTSVTTYPGTTLKLLPYAADRGSLDSYTTLGSTAVSNWAVAQKSDYEAIFQNLGSTTGDNKGKTYDANVNAYITTGVGGTAISGDCWSATDDGGSYAWRFGSEKWLDDNRMMSHSVRPVLGFGGEATEASSFTEVTTFSELNTALSTGKNVKLMNDIVCTAEIEITSNRALTIDGNGKKFSTTSAIRAFKVGSSATVAFKNLTLTGFVNGGGPAINNSGTIVLDGCTISNCHVNNSNGGGAIENKSSGKLYAINTTFSGNYSGEIGGAINNYTGSLYMSGCTFTNNYTTSSNAFYGGAIGINGGSEVRLINCSFSGNKYGTNTGTNDIGVYWNPTSYTIAGCTGATIASDDGVITPNTTGTATLNYSDLSNISFTYTAE